MCLMEQVNGTYIYYVLNGAGQWGICIIMLNGTGQWGRCMCLMEQVSGTYVCVGWSRSVAHMC